MRVFLTGATGFVGSDVARELLDAGHEVVGLSRTAAGDAKLVQLGVEPRRGTLADLDALTEGARDADGVIHCAFIHDDFSDFTAAVSADYAAVRAMGDALAGSGKPFITTSGTAVGMALSGRAVRESDPAPTEGWASLRGESERITLGFAERGVRSIVMRLPQVHGDGDHHGFIPRYIAMSRASGRAAYVGDGANHWPAVHRPDLARLYRLALENAPAGSTLHGVGEEGVSLRDVAEVVARRAGVPAASLTPDEATAHFGWFAGFAMMDNVASSAWTRAQLGWNPTGPGLLADIDRPAYFEAAA